MKIPQLLAHHNDDNVGVVVVEGVAAGDELFCVVTKDNSDFTIKSKNDAPIQAGERARLRLRFLHHA